MKQSEVKGLSVAELQEELGKARGVIANLNKNNKGGNNNNS